MMPFNVLGIWFRCLLAVAIVIGAAYFLREGYERSLVDEPVVATIVSTPAADTVSPSPEPAQPISTTRKVFHIVPEWNEANKAFLVGFLFVLWALLGRFIRAAIAGLVLSFTRSKNSAQRAVSLRGESDEDPKPNRSGEIQNLERPDGSVIRVESYGSKLAPVIVWCHGWGQNSTEWFYQKENLAKNYRLVVWDEPGMGLSTKPENNDFRLEKFASDLASVIEVAGAAKVFLAGHSIGGMTILTFCKMFPDILRTKVAGLILAHTTYTNPVRTTKMATLYRAIEKPVLVPLLYLMIFTWPLVWLMNWMAYLNGSTHQSTHKSSFAGTETLGQLDFIARNQTYARPDTLARGMLGMLQYDATATLSKIDVPALVVAGDKDKTTLPEAGRYIAANIPIARLEMLSPARHHGLMEHHGWFDTLVKDFVDSTRQRT